MHAPSDPNAEMPKAGLFNDETLRKAVMVLAVLGVLVALYLVYIKYNPTSAFCLAAGGCEAVNTSRYSEIAGIPIAIFGALAYLAILGLAAVEPRSALVKEWGPVAAFGLALTGTLYSAYLTYIEIAVIHQICPYCVTSAVLITLIMVVSAWRLRGYLG